MYKLIQTDGNVLNINADQEIKDHFENNSRNHALTIIKQINEDEFYKKFFKGKSDLVVLDIGANVGLFSLHVLPSCKKIIALEPTPSHYNLLKKLTDGSLVETRWTALSDHCGVTSFSFDANNSTMNSIINGNPVSGIEVGCLDLNGILEAENIDHVDFCKVDIEGSEVIALTESTINKTGGKIKQFFVEVHPTEHFDGMNQHANKMKLIEVFVSCGYEVSDINFETFIATWKN